MMSVYVLSSIYVYNIYMNELSHILFDICIIKKMSKLHFIKVFPKVFEGKHTDDPFVEIFRTKEMKLESDYDFSVFADGEYICKLPAVFKIAPGKLNFLLPS